MTARRPTPKEFAKLNHGKPYIPQPDLRALLVKALAALEPFETVVAIDSPLKDNDPVFQSDDDLLAKHFHLARTTAAEIREGLGNPNKKPAQP